MRTKVKLLSAILCCCLLLSACGGRATDKVIRYTYMPRGEITLETPESYNNNVEVYTIWVDEAPATIGDAITTEEAKAKVNEHRSGCWEIVESSTFGKDIEELSTFILTLGAYTRTQNGDFGQYNRETSEFYELLRIDTNAVFFRISQKEAADFITP